DPRFAEREARKVNRDILRDEIEQRLACDGAAHWAARLNRHGVPAGEVLSVPDVLDHPQIRERGLVRIFDDVEGVDRPVRVVRSGFRLGSGDPGPKSPPPALGADTDDILAGLGYAPEIIASLRREKAI
ncbi:MAG TPA: CoA transferase, partial [Rhabdaerophilum sp.]|nr:CoA transferase [Rhabdaerophilum sp.]